jgi:23S rRNA pseudouridine1911/1915/1917 synthase
MENTLLRLVQKQTPNANPVHRLGRATTGIVLFAKTPRAASLDVRHYEVAFFA